MVTTVAYSGPGMSYGSSASRVAESVVLSSSFVSSSSNRTLSSAPTSSLAVSLASELSSYLPSESDVTNKQRGVRDVESRPVCVWPLVGMGGGGLP